ncbi:MAG: LacI family DNA-binding transcriptional regulator [Streptosporangiales bacterium]|nr:LacI family DNA-binding transcriptional regulator [Streptosporangiales bacterium]
MDGGSPRVVTQREVADRAGVSVRTVSNVVNEFAYVADETRARVQQALDDLGYRPNLVARSLSQGRSGLLALVLPFDVPYFTELAAHVVDQAEARGYTVLLDRTEGVAERERELVLRRDRTALFDGLLFSPLGLTEDDLRRRVGNCPVVLLGERPAEMFDRVAIDDEAAARRATEHLLDLGRRRIAVIGEVVHRRRDTAAHRSAGYRKALRAAGIADDPGLTMVVERFQREDGLRAMERLLDLDEPPDAVFCFNDLLALGAMRAVLARGLRVPDDVAIAGFDDIEDGRYSTPTLTTVSPDKAEIAVRAVEQLARRMSGDTSPPDTVSAPWRLAVRESTAGRGHA